MCIVTQIHKNFAMRLNNIFVKNLSKLTLSAMLAIFNYLILNDNFGEEIFLRLANEIFNASNQAILRLKFFCLGN